MSHKFSEEGLFIYLVYPWGGSKIPPLTMQVTLRRQNQASDMKREVSKKVLVWQLGGIIYFV